MRVWAVANQKGGVGKTTTAITLAGVLAMRGLRTLVVDLDAHGSLTSYLGMDPDHVENSAYRLFQENPVSPIQIIAETRFRRVHLLPASTAMATLDRQLGAQTGKGLVISSALQRVQDMYDVVIMDCPPTLGILMVNALAACDHLIIPVQTEFLAIKGLERMLHTLAMIQRSIKREVPHTIVPTLFDKRTRASLDSLEALRAKYLTHLWSSVIPVDTQFRDASRLGIPLPMRSMTERGVLAYAALADFLMPELRDAQIDTPLAGELPPPSTVYNPRILPS